MTGSPPLSDHDRCVPMPAAATTLRPKRSIFTLRPLSHTEAPGPAPAFCTSRRRAGFLFALVALGALPAVAWGMRGKHKPEARAPIVLVNGAPQTKLTAQGSVERWGEGTITVSIDSSVDALGPGAREAIQAGFGAWLGSGAKLPALVFDTTSGKSPKLEPDGVNAVLLAPIAFPGHKKALAITIGFADPATGRIVESDTVLNAKKPFALLDSPPAGHGASDDDDPGDDAHEAPGCDGWYDVQAVMTHEAGHFFGLDEDMDDDASTMFYKTGKCELKKRDLEGPDRSVMTMLYESPPPAGGESATDTGAGCGGASTSGRGPASSGVAALGALVALVLLSRRRAACRAASP